MTTQEKIAHLHRRLGFGATPDVIERDAKAGVEATVQRLLKPVPSSEPHPYEFSWREKSEADVGSWPYRCWWVYNMLTAENPIRDRLALFWHSHFAVSDTKVEDGILMLGYLQTIRRHSLGNFGDLLLAVAQDPAMMRYLDMERALRGRPNENFAREVMELFTLGIDGGYTERDVKEVARALTGWGYLHTFWEMPGDHTRRLRESLQDNRPFASFIQIPAMHDDGNKVILGHGRRWTGEATLGYLAQQPATARFIARKLWAHFAYADAAAEVIQPIAEAFQKSDGSILETLRAMVHHPEFFSDRAMRSQVKSPAEYVIGLGRTQGLGTYLRSLRDPKATPETRISQRILDETGYVVYRMERMGQGLLFPPDVAGWPGGKEWISASAMTERQQYVGNIFWLNDKPAAGGLGPVSYLRKLQPKTPREVADAICRLYDVNLPQEAREIMARPWANLDALKDDGWAVGSLHTSLRLMVAAPETHLQ